MKQLELRVNAIEFNSDEEMVLEGYVNKTEQLSKKLGGFREKVEKGCFARAIERAESIKLLFEHNSESLLASTKNGSLSLEEDKKGLKIRATLIDTTLGQDTYKLVKAGLIDAMSFGFYVIEDNWEKVDGENIRTIKDLELIEVSIVENPAYVQSSISARGYEVIENIEVPVVEEEVELREEQTIFNDIELYKAKIKMYELEH